MQINTIMKYRNYINYIILLTAFVFIGCADDKDEPILDGPYDITPQLIWDCHAYWVEAREVTYKENNKTKTGYLLLNYYLEDAIIFGKKYVKTVLAREDVFSFTESHNNEYLRLDGTKVYGLDIETGEEILFHDFSTWVDGGDITIQSINDGPEHIHADYFSELDCSLAEEYDSKSPWKIYGINGQYDYIRYIGEINGRGLTNYKSRTREGATFDFGVVSDKSTIIIIYNGRENMQNLCPFIHPEYHRFINSEVDLRMLINSQL